LPEPLFHLSGYGLKDLAANVLGVLVDKEDGVRRSNWEEDLSDTQVNFLLLITTRSGEPTELIIQVAPLCNSGLVQSTTSARYLSFIPASVNTRCIYALFF